MTSCILIFFITPQIVSKTDCKDDKIGKVIYISGTPDGSLSAIDIINAPPSLLDKPFSPDSFPDFAFHFKLLFAGNTVVRNTFNNRSWGKEETGGGMPFIPNVPYTATIVLQQNGYEIAVNGVHFASYTYRLPLTTPMTVLVNAAQLGNYALVEVV